MPNVLKWTEENKLKLKWFTSLGQRIQTEINDCNVCAGCLREAGDSCVSLLFAINDITEGHSCLMKHTVLYFSGRNPKVYTPTRQGSQLYLWQQFRCPFQEAAHKLMFSKCVQAWFFKVLFYLLLEWKSLLFYFKIYFIFLLSHWKYLR